MEIYAHARSGNSSCVCVIWLRSSQFICLTSFAETIGVKVRVYGLIFSHNEPSSNIDLLISMVKDGGGWRCNGGRTSSGQTKLIGSGWIGSIGCCRR